MIDNRLLKLLQNFYIEKMHSLIAQYNRTYKVSIVLQLIKAFYFTIILLSQSSLKSISSEGKGFQFFSELDIEQAIDSDHDTLLYVQLSILLLDIGLIIYIFVKFLIYSSLSIQNLKQIHLQGMSIAGKNKQKQHNSSNHELFFSFIFQTYEYVFMIPSVYLACALQTQLSVPALILTLLNGIIIKDLDFDYLISTQDYLAKKYAWYEKVVYMIQCLFIAIYSTEKGAVGLWMILFNLLFELCYILFKRPFFSKKLEGIIIWILLYLCMLYITALWLRGEDDIGPSLFFILLTIFLPISLKIARTIMKKYDMKIRNQFDLLINSNSLSVEDNSSQYVDQILRMIVYQDKVGLNNDKSIHFNIVSSDLPKDQAEKYRDFLKINLLRTFQSKLLHEVELEIQMLKRKKNEAGQITNKSKTKKMKQSVASGYSENNSYYDEAAMAEREIEAYNEAKQDILLQQFQVDEKLIEGKQYINKVQIYGDDLTMQDNLQMYFHRVIQNSKDRAQFSDVDILHLVYILEILGNEKLFELKLNQLKKKISFKQLQILKTLEYCCDDRKKMHIKEFGKNSIFHPEYQEALSYDSLLSSLQHWIDETIEKKIAILNLMRQRHITLSQLKNQLEEVQGRRVQLIKTISHLVQLNDKNSKLHALYICYLENLSFTDKDINLSKLKKQQSYNSDQRNYLAKLDRGDSCLIFTSLARANKGLSIRRTSKNFEKIYNYKFSEIKDQPVEKLLPYPYQKQHQKLVKNFFNDSQQNEKGFVPLGFTLTQKGYILPVEVSIRVSHFGGEFGMAAFIQVIDKSEINFDPLSTIYNYSSKEYIVYDEGNLKIISMTIALHKLLFIRYKSMHQVFLRGFFPFLKKIYQNNSLRSSRTNRSGGKSSNNLLQSSRYMNSNRSISSSRKRAEINKNKSLQPEKKSKKDKKKKKNQIENSTDQGNIQKQLSIGKSTIEKHETIQFMMIVQREDSLSSDANPQFIEKNFQFFTMIIRMCETQLGGDAKAVTYLELTKIQEINAFNSCAFLLNVFDDQINILSNKQFFTQLVQNRIIDHLENFYLFQQLVQSGELDLTQYNFYIDKYKLFNSWNFNMNSKYSNNELYQFYVFEGHKLVPEGINEMEGEKNDEVILEYAKNNETKNSSPNQAQKIWQLTHQQSDLINQQSMQPGVVSEEALASYFDNDTPQNKNMHMIYQKQISKQNNKLRNQTTLENAKQIGGNQLEYAKQQEPYNQKANGPNEKQVKQQMKQNQKTQEEIYLVNSYIEVQGQSDQKPKDLNDILYESKMDSPSQQKQNNNFQQGNHYVTSIQSFNAPLSAQSNKPNINFNSQENMGYAKVSEAPNNTTQHAVFGAAMLQQNQTFMQNIQSTDISQQQLIGLDYSKVNQNDQSILSPENAQAIYFNQNGNGFSSQNNVYTPMNSNGQFNFQQSNIFSPNNDSNIDVIAQNHQSYQNLMNQSGGAAAAQNDMQKQLSKTSKFFSSKLNQASQLKSFRTKLNQQSVGVVAQQIPSMNPASQDASKNYSQKSNTADNDGDETKTKKKEYENIKDAGESSSTHSKLSNLSSQKKQVNHIIFSTKDLQAMKVINFFGLLSIAVIISVTLYQYYSMNLTFSDFQSDSEVADWPMRFISNMSLISKAKNYLLLSEADFFKFTPEESAIQTANKIAELQDAFQKELTRITEMHKPLKTQQLFYYLLDNDYSTSISSLFGEGTDLSKVNSNDNGNFKYIDINTTIFYGLTVIHQYLYRFAFGSGIPRGQYVSLLNQDKLEVELENVFIKSQDEQNQGINDIRTQLTSLMILILIICPLCISIVIPLYSFIQTRRQEILALFGTFSIQRLEACIQDIRFTSFYVYDPSVVGALSQKQNILNKIVNHNNESIKKQTLSSSTPLPKFSIALFFCALVVFVFTLPYPIINQQISNRYMDESVVALKLKSKNYLHILQYNFEMMIQQQVLFTFCIIIYF